MTISVDVRTDDTGNPQTVNYSFTHVGGAGPKGACLVIMQAANLSDESVTATYGGVSMSHVSNSPRLGVGGSSDRNHVQYILFVGSGISSGSQTVSITKSASASFRAFCFTLNTASGNVEEQNTDVSIRSDSESNPTGTITLGGNTCWVYQSVHSGRSQTSQITPLSGWTSRAEIDNGGNVDGWYEFDTIGSSDVTIGWTQAADDTAGFSVALKEAAGGVPGAVFGHNHFHNTLN